MDQKTAATLESSPGAMAGSHPPGSAAAPDPASPPHQTAAGRSLLTTLWASTTYFGEGLPYSVVHLMTPQYFTAMGATLRAIGFTSLYGLAWNLKLLWAPLVDLTGTKRRWVIATQLILAALIAALAIPAAAHDLYLFAWLLIPVAFMAATQDVAVDGFYLQALDDRQQAGYSGVRVAAYRIAMLVGNGALVILAGTVSWLAAYLTAAVMMAALALAHRWLLPRPVAAISAPGQPRAGTADFARAFTTFLEQPRVAIAIAFILTFRLGDAMMIAMQVPFLKHLGLETAERGFILGTIGTIGAIGGSILGGILIAKLGLNRCIWPLSVIQSLSIPGYIYMALARPDRLTLTAILTFEQIAAGVGTAVFVVFLMRRCRSRYRASHFAIVTALMSITVTVSGSLSGILADRLGFPHFFMLCFALTWPGLVLIPFLPRQPADALDAARA